MREHRGIRGAASSTRGRFRLSKSVPLRAAGRDRRPQPLQSAQEPPQPAAAAGPGVVVQHQFRTRPSHQSWWRRFRDAHLILARVLLAVLANGLRPSRNRPLRVRTTQCVEPRSRRSPACPARVAPGSLLRTARTPPAGSSSDASPARIPRLLPIDRQGVSSARVFSPDTEVRPRAWFGVFVAGRLSLRMAGHPASWSSAKLPSCSAAVGPGDVRMGSQLVGYDT